MPIFANNKKKRLKQALYANPTADDFVEQTTIGKDFFETKKTEPQQRSCPSPSNDEAHNSLSVTRQSKYQTCVRGGRGGITHLPSPGGSHTGNNQGGLQNCTPVKPEQQRFQNTGNVLSRANSTIKSSQVRFVNEGCRCMIYETTFNFLSVHLCFERFEKLMRFFLSFCCNNPGVLNSIQKRMQQFLL